MVKGETLSQNWLGAEHMVQPNPFKLMAQYLIHQREWPLLRLTIGFFKQFVGAPYKFALI